jgi:hypothetical protein
VSLARTRGALPLAVCLLLLTGCPAGAPETTPTVDEGPVVVEGRSHTLRSTQEGWEGEVPFAYHNVTDRTISLLNCRGGFGLHLEKRVEGDWVRAWEPAGELCLSPPIEIPPGEQHEHTLHVFDARPDANVFPRFDVDGIPGSYRIVITSAYWDYDHDGPPWGEMPPMEARVSAPFELRVR